jgi:ABC-type glycerol-3-phosphate transport system permease component
VLWGYLQNLSEEFEQAAMVDGCTRLGAFWRITLPLTLPGVAAAALFCFLEGWNQYLLAYVLSSSSANWVVSLGLFSFIGEYITNVEQMMAASVVASIPSIVLFVILQRYLKGGLTAGGLTG